MVTPRHRQKGQRQKPPDEQPQNGQPVLVPVELGQRPVPDQRPIAPLDFGHLTGRSFAQHHQAVPRMQDITVRGALRNEGETQLPFGIALHRQADPVKATILQIGGRIIDDHRRAGIRLLHIRAAKMPETEKEHGHQAQHDPSGPAKRGPAHSGFRPASDEISQRHVNTSRQRLPHSLSEDVLRPDWPDGCDVSGDDDGTSAGRDVPDDRDVPVEDPDAPDEDRDDPDERDDSAGRDAPDDREDSAGRDEPDDREDPPRRDEPDDREDPPEPAEPDDREDPPERDEPEDREAPPRRDEPDDREDPAGRDEPDDRERRRLRPVPRPEIAAYLRRPESQISPAPHSAHTSSPRALSRFLYREYSASASPDTST